VAGGIVLPIGEMKGRITAMSGSGGRIAVTPEQLEGTSSQLNNAASNIESTLSQVKAQVESIAGVWQGAAAMEFQNLLTQWNTDAQDLHAVLTQIAVNLNKAAEAYRQADSGIAQGFSVG
jgi:WXG100 family type VII secretion target